MTMNYPYDTTLEEHEIADLYDRIMNVIKARNPEARYACIQVNFDDDDVSNPYFYLSNLFDSQINEIGTDDYNGQPYSPGISGLADNGTTRAIYALDIPDEVIRQWEGWSVAFDLEERRTLADEERESLWISG